MLVGVLVAWSRKSCLGPAEIASFASLVLFKNVGLKVSPRFHLFVSNVNQGNKTLTSRSFYLKCFGIHVPNQSHIHRCPPDILNTTS